MTIYLLKWLCEDFRAINIVQSKSFKRFIKAATGGRYRVPSRNTLMKLLGMLNKLTLKEVCALLY